MVMVVKTLINLLRLVSLALPLLGFAIATGQAQNSVYTVNGSSVAPEMGALLQHYGFESGAYYIDPNGNYGRSGGPPLGNLSGGPMRGWNGVEPTGIDGNPYAQAYINGVAGIRIFYVYSPSIFSDIKGGASGYYHICADNRYYQEHDGAVSMGGGPNEAGIADRSWVGTAHQSNAGGRWQIEDGPQGPTLALHASIGGAQRVPITTLLQGKFEYNQTKYIVEPGKAAC